MSVPGSAPHNMSEEFYSQASGIIRDLKNAGVEPTVENVTAEYERAYGIAPILLLFIGPFLEWLIPFILNHEFGDSDNASGSAPTI